MLSAIILSSSPTSPSHIHYLHAHQPSSLQKIIEYCLLLHLENFESLHCAVALLLTMEFFKVRLQVHLLTILASFIVLLVEQMVVFMDCLDGWVFTVRVRWGEKAIIFVSAMVFSGM